MRLRVDKKALVLSPAMLQTEHYGLHSHPLLIVDGSVPKLIALYSFDSTLGPKRRRLYVSDFTDTIHMTMYTGLA